MRTRIAAITVAVAATVVLAAGCTAAVSTPGHHATAHAGAPAGASSASVRPTAVATSPAARSPVLTTRRRPDPCRHNSGGQLVRVSLHRQRMWLCAHHRVVRRSAITSGMIGQYTETPRGHFAIQALERDQTLTLISGQQYQVKFWIPFNAPLFGFHDASWQTFPFGSPRYRTAGSHGCVHLPLRTIAFLYHWAHVGTRVVIR